MSPFIFLLALHETAVLIELLYMQNATLVIDE